MGGGSSKKQAKKESDSKLEQRLKAEEQFFHRDRVKVAIMGLKGVGKTACFNRWVENKFDGEYESTVRANVGVRSIKCKSGDLLTFELWDIPSDALIDMRTTLFDGVDAVVFVADLTQPYTLGAIERTNKELLKFVPKEKVEAAEAQNRELKRNSDDDDDDDSPNRAKMSHPLPCVLVANKCDSGVRATRRQVDVVAQEHGFLASVMASAKRDERMYDVLKILRHHFVPDDDLPVFARYDDEEEDGEAAVKDGGDDKKKGETGEEGASGQNDEAEPSEDKTDKADKSSKGRNALAGGVGQSSGTGKQDGNNSGDDEGVSEDAKASGATLMPLPVLRKNTDANTKANSGSGGDDDDDKGDNKGDDSDTGPDESKGVNPIPGLAPVPNRGASGDDDGDE